MRNPLRNELSYSEAKEMMTLGRGVVDEMLDLLLEFGSITQRERDIMYFRHIEWNSLENVGKKFALTRERIRQIEAKVEVLLNEYTKKVHNETKKEI
jgi:DNA-directed RNA polymerase sigma subunit (sigma70/sigma32)